MSNIISLGRIARPGEDIFPTTGPHLDVRVKPLYGEQKGQYIDPTTRPNLLQNILVGPNQTPLYQQQEGGFKSNYRITSGFGKRPAPTKGASTIHRGSDFGIGPETLGYRGTGTFTQRKGYGELLTQDEQGNPYMMQFFHTVGGDPQPQKTASVKPKDATAPAAGKPTSTPQRKEKANKLLSSLLREQIVGNTLEEALNPASFMPDYGAVNQPFADVSAARNKFIMGLLD